MTNSPTTQILIADDDVELCSLLCEYLAQQGLDALAVHSAESAIEHLKKGEEDHHVDVLVLDVMLPGMDGLTALRSIREFASLPVVMLSGRGEPVDRVVGLELGADDYLSKPCLPRELLARIHALMRRAGKPSSADQPNEAIEVGPLKIRPAERRAQCMETTLALTGAEFSILEVLMRNVGNLVSRQAMTEAALNRPLEKFDRAVDVHISRLRQKLAAAETGLQIESVRGAGYQLLIPTAR